MPRVEEYLRPDGSNPFRRWFEGLPPQAGAKVAMAVFRLTQGHRANLKWFGGIGEYRIDWGPGYRIYLLHDGVELILLLGGGTKRRQHTDIERAQVLRREYLARQRTE